MFPATNQKTTSAFPNKKKKKMGVTVVIVAWLDASQDSGGDVHFKTDDLSLSFAISAGVLVKETKTYVAIARDYFPHVDKTCDQVRNREVISKKDIQWIKRFDL